MPEKRTVDAGAAAASKRSPWASLSYQQFRWLFASNQAFFFAMNGQFIVRSYLAFKLTDSALALGVINLAVAVPMLLVSPFGGVIADRLERRKLIMASQFALLLNEAIVLALILGGVLAFWHLVAVTIVTGAIFPFMMPARQAIVVDVVGKNGLGNAMALQMGGMNAARVVAPVLAGFLIYLVGVEWTYVVAIVLYLMALSAMTRVNPSRAIARAVGSTMRGEMAEGFRYVWQDRPVRALLLMGLIPITLMMPFQTLLVVFAEDVWDTGSRGLGILQGAAGVGGIVGSLAVAWRAKDPSMRVMLYSLFAFAGGLLFFAMSPWFLLGVAMVVFADVFIAMFQTLNNTAINLIIPDHVRGRVMSMMMMTFGLTPLGTVPVSAAAEAFGAPVAVAGASVVSVVAVAGLMLWNRSLRLVDGLIAENAENAVGPVPFSHGVSVAPAAPAVPAAVPRGAPGS
ncbi:MAG: MFS transporter [Dehalococcoidia bacterium]